MYATMLVRHGESKAEEDLLHAIVKSHQSGLQDFIEWRNPYAFIEHIKKRTNYSKLHDELERSGITVWLITKPSTDGNHKVIYNRKGRGFDGISLMQELLKNGVPEKTK